MFLKFGKFSCRTNIDTVVISWISYSLTLLAKVSFAAQYKNGRTMAFLNSCFLSLIDKVTFTWPPNSTNSCLFSLQICSTEGLALKVTRKFSIPESERCALTPNRSRQKQLHRNTDKSGSKPATSPHMLRSRISYCRIHSTLLWQAAVPYCILRLH